MMKMRGNLRRTPEILRGIPQFALVLPGRACLLRDTRSSGCDTRSRWAVTPEHRPETGLPPEEAEGDGVYQDDLRRSAMRSPKSRSRGKPNRNRPSGSNVNRVFDSSGPEGKVRGTPQQIIDKYHHLTRDAQLANDRVAAENFLQHAEHYARLLGDAQREAEARKAEHEAQQRKRQEQRDADRAGGGGRQDAPPAPAPALDPYGTPQGGIAGAIGSTGGDSGLVETPESSPNPKRERRPRPTSPEAGAGSTAPELPEPEAPEAAE